jgi:hypothetical protein
MERPDDNDSEIEIVQSSTRKFVFGCGSMYLITDELRDRPLRVFLKKGHSGVCVQALLEAIGRLVTIMIQKTDLPLSRVEKTLKGITCEAGMVYQVSCMDALARELEARFPERSKYVEEDYEPCAPTD